MIEAHPRIEHGDDDAVAARGRIPGRRDRHRGRLCGLQIPLVREQRIVRQGVRVSTTIGFGEGDGRIRAQVLERSLHIVSRQRDGEAHDTQGRRHFTDQLQRHACAIADACDRLEQFLAAPRGGRGTPTEQHSRRDVLTARLAQHRLILGRDRHGPRPQPSRQQHRPKTPVTPGPRCATGNTVATTARGFFWHGHRPEVDRPVARRKIPKGRSRRVRGVRTDDHGGG